MKRIIGVESWNAVCNADRGVARARAARHEAQPRPAGELALRLGHVARAAFVAAGDEADAVAMLVEAVERGEEAFAGNAERGRRALRDQRFDEGVAGGARRREGHERSSVQRDREDRRRGAAVCLGVRPHIGSGFAPDVG